MKCVGRLSNGDILVVFTVCVCVPNNSSFPLPRIYKYLLTELANYCKHARLAER